jgi:carbon-monoxide dehydrogenase small subunit
VHDGTGTAERIRPAEPIPQESATPVASIPDFTPNAVLTQQFSVTHPPAQVFAMFDDIAAVTACLPGASLTMPPDPARVEGAFRVKLGPITATFSGLARVERNPDDMSGRIVGIGKDRRSRSTTQGEIRYRLVPTGEGAATRIELSIGYTLTGMLAQVGRPGLVRDLAERLIAEFAGNLDRCLSGAGPAGADTVELNGVSLASGLLRARVARWLGRFFSNKDGTA